MFRRTNKFVPVMLKRARSKRSGWKTAFLVLFGLVALVVAVILVVGNQKQPFSTVIPSTTPAEAVSTTPSAVDAYAPEETRTPANTPDAPVGQYENGQGEEEETAQAQNPVETLLFAYREAYKSSEEGFLAVAKAHSLRMLSFKLALAQANGTVEDVCSYFLGLVKGETPGEWGDGSARIKASGGNYTITAEFNTGARIEGKISSTMTRMSCTVYGTDGETPVRTIEVVKGTDGYYAQVWDEKSVYPGIRYYTGPNGLHCAIGSEQGASVFEEVPINWNAFAKDYSEAVRCTEGGAILTLYGEEIICNLS
ncbi:MAG: hypothetical protein ACOYI3_01540 [Christensenellales bacterium]|jgi:hypothetical protein